MADCREASPTTFIISGVCDRMLRRPQYWYAVDGLRYTLTRKRTKMIVINIRELSTLYPLSTHRDKVERVDFDCIASVYWALCCDNIVVHYNDKVQVPVPNGTTQIIMGTCSL